MQQKAMVLIMSLLLMITGGCATLQDIVQKPSVRFEGVSFRNMSLFEATPIFKLKVTNPNPIGISVGSIAYDLKINNAPFIKDVLDKGVSIKASGSEFIEFPVTFNYFDLLESVTAFNTTDTISYDLSGSVMVGILELPYHTKGTFPVPKLPDVSLKNIDISNISLTGASILFSLELENNNPFTIKLNGLDYEIKLAGKEFAKGSSRTVAAIDRNGKAGLEIPLNLSFLRLGRAVYNILTKDSSGYELTGAMKFDIPDVGEKFFPFQKHGEVSLRR